MTRVLNRFYIAQDHTKACWCVLEHNSKLNNTIKTDLTYDEAEIEADERNEEYEKTIR